MIAVSALSVAAVLLPTLIGTHVIVTDALELVIPQLAFYKSAFTSGESPFWNPYLAVGFPNFISMNGFPLAPLNLMLYFLPAVTVHYWGMFLTLTAAFFFTVLFLRKIGVSVAGSYIAAFAYLAGNIYFARDLVLSAALFEQAALFWILAELYFGDRRKRFWYILLGAVLVGYGWWTAAYYPILYIAMAVFGFALFFGLRGERLVHPPHRSAMWRVQGLKHLLVPLIIIFFIGTMIGVLQLVPAYVMLQFSQRAEGFGHAGDVIGPAELFNFFHLTPSRGLDAYLFMGITAFVFFVFSFWIRKNHFVTFFRWMFFGALVLSIQGSPLFSFLVKLPVFNMFQGAARFMLIGMFAAAVLAGFGFDYLIKLRFEDLKKLPVRLTIVAAAIGVILLTTSLIFPKAIISVLLSLIFLMTVFLVWRFMKNRQLTVFSCIVLVILEFIIIFYRFNGATIALRSFYEQDPLTAAFLLKKPGRILPLFADDWDDGYFYQWFDKLSPPAEEADYLFQFSRETYRPNFQLLEGIPNLEANEPLLNIPMGRMMALLGTRQLVTAGGEEKLNKIYVTSEVIKEVPIQGSKEVGVIKEITDSSPKVRYKLLKERLPLIEFLGIRYAFSVFNLTEFDIELPRRAQGRLDIMGSGLPPMPLTIYEIPGVRPLAYFTKISGFKENSDSAYQAFKASGFRGIFVECTDCESREFNGLGDVDIVLEENGRVKANTASETDQFLIFTQNYLPGWRASIDGEETEIYKVNSVFPGIFVPAGNHAVEFVYDYWSLFNPEFLLGLFKK